MLLASGDLFLAATGGAVAATMITISQIQDNTIRSVDVHDGTLTHSDLSAATKASLQGFCGYERLQDSKLVTGGTATSLTLLCPAGKTIISG